MIRFPCPVLLWALARNAPYYRTGDALCTDIACGVVTGWDDIILRVRFPRGADWIGLAHCVGFSPRMGDYVLAVYIVPSPSAARWPPEAAYWRCYKLWGSP